MVTYIQGGTYLTLLSVQYTFMGGSVKEYVCSNT